MKKMHRSQGGFTLVEILIVLALLGILLAVVIPNLTGFLGRGKDESYRGDSRSIQAAVDAYYTDTQKRPGARLWPNNSGGGAAAGTCVVTNGTGAVASNCATVSWAYINMNDLKSEGYLRDVPKSASSANNGGVSGSYIWFVHSSGVVTSAYVGTTSVARGYVDGIYP